MLGRCVAAVLLATIAGSAAAQGGSLQTESPQPPVVGEAARDFTLSRLDGSAVTLSTLRATGPVVVLMLRGWVGYQ
jgi:cytochrome oxidase Cu insertion factor (SCO1/SenC/PrrC family)